MISRGSAAGRPWLRFLARNIDLNLFFTLIYLFLFLFYPKTAHDLITNPIRDALFWLTSVAIWIVIETMLLRTFGTTPGKWFFNLRVEDANQNKLDVKRAFSRSVHVWLKGMGMGILIFSVFTFIYSYYYLIRQGVAPWDKKEKINVVCGERENVRLILFVLLFCGATIAFYCFASYRTML